MDWPWHFPGTLPPEAVQARRMTLDRYAVYAQLSVLAPTLLWLLVRGVVSLVRGAFGLAGTQRYDAVPQSPAAKRKRLSVWGALGTWGRRARWWFGEDAWMMGESWGTRGQWVFGTLWFAWSVALCVLETGTDYLHLTKRFGVVAASQLLLQYLLSLKSFNLFAAAFSTSHEALNRWHRTLGRVLYALLIMHVALYLNFLAQNGLLVKRFSELIVLCGVGAFILLNIMLALALTSVRRASYRVFFLAHLVAAFAIPALLFIHVGAPWVFPVEALLVFVVDLVVRKLRWTTKAMSRLELVQGTNLVKISASVPANTLEAFRSRPGSHVYLSLHPGARPTANPLAPSYMFYEATLNPFTVAAVDEEKGELVLVARQLRGPLTTRLAHLASASRSSSEPKIPLSIEGPYGETGRNFATLAGGVDRVLLIAGGIGATFTVPIYQALQAESPAPKVELVWTLRKRSELSWLSGTNARGILGDENARIFITGDETLDSPVGVSSGSDNGEIELSELQDRRKESRKPFAAGVVGVALAGSAGKRPDLQKVVDEVFRKGSEERVAVLVCGPEGMAREVRKAVAVWVKKGRDVMWHDEGFGW